MTPQIQESGCIVEIGGLAISFRGDDPQFFQSVRERYLGFLSQRPPDFDLHVSTNAAASDAELEVFRDGGDWIMKRGDFHARWDPRTKRGTIRQNRNPYAIDCVLRILHSLVLAGRGGFLLHAASAVCEDRAYLFSGISGAGKTTITRLAPKDVVLLTDEISYIRGCNHRYSACGTPFTGELDRAGENCSAPIAALFFLEKGQENRVEQMSESCAVQR